MARTKPRKKPRTSRKRAAGGRWFLFLLLFLIGTGLLYWQRGDLVAGLQVGVRSLIGVEEIAVASDLVRAGKAGHGVASVRGIPDYDGRLRVRSEQGMLTCFRMVGFENRLFVCTDGRLRNPEEVKDVLRELRFTGSLQKLAGSRFEEAMSRGFVSERGIRPDPGAWLLLTGSLQGASLLKTVLLSLCALLCIFFLLGFILSLRR